MADGNKINQEQSISRVYQFLSNDTEWLEKADKNGNGMVEKSEFRSYLLGSDGDLLWDGETSKEKDDLIDKFWKSVDTKTSGKMSVGSKSYSNKYTLDTNELKKMEANIEAATRVRDFMSGVNPPASLKGDATLERNWMNSVKEGLINRASDIIKKGGSIDDITQEWLEGAFKLSAAKATAGYTATVVITEKFGGNSKYDQDEDAILKSLINNYVAKLEKNPKDEATIENEIRALIEAYVDTAETNSEASIKLLSEYNYNGYGKLNELQKSVLRPIIKQQITETTDSKVATDIADYIKKNSEKELNVDIKADVYSSQIDNLIDKFIDQYLNGKGANEFASLKEFDGAQFVQTNEYKTLIADVSNKIIALETAKQDLIDYVDEILGQNNANKTRAVEDKFSNLKTRDEIVAEINKMTDPEAINKLKAELQDKIDEIESQLDDSFLSALTDAVVSIGETKVIRLPNSTEKYSTGELTFKIEKGNSNISVDSTTGAVTITGNQVGTFRDVEVAVYGPNNKKLTSKKITITVQESASSIANSVTGWNGQHSEHLEAVTPSGDDGFKMKNTLTDKSFSDMYNDDDIVRLHISMDDSEDWEDAGNMINERLTQLGNLIYSALLTTGLDSSILRKAVDNVINGYKNGKFAEGCLNDDDDGTSSDDLTNNLVWRMRNDRSGTGHRVVGTRDDDGRDSWVWGVRFKDVVDDIIKEYNALSSGQSSTVTATRADDSGQTDSHSGEDTFGVIAAAASFLTGFVW